MKPKVLSFPVALSILLCFSAGQIASEMSNEIDGQSAFQAAVMVRLSKIESEFQDQMKTLLEAETVKLNDVIANRAFREISARPGCLATSRHCGGKSRHCGGAEIADWSDKVVTLTNKNDELHDKIGYLEGEIIVLSNEKENARTEITSLWAETSKLKKQVEYLSENPPIVKYQDAFQHQVSEMSRNSVPRSCAEALAANPGMSNGTIFIDPDGQGIGDPPIRAYCDAATGIASISHDSSEATIEVTKCRTPGCYSRSITYDNA